MKTIKEIRSDYVDDNNYRHVDVWFSNDENAEGKTVALFCEDTGKHFYMDNVYSLNDGVKTTLEVLKQDWDIQHDKSDLLHVTLQDIHNTYLSIECPIKRTIIVSTIHSLNMRMNMVSSVVNNEHTIDEILNEVLLDDSNDIPDEHKHDFYKGLDCPFRRTTLKAMKRFKKVNTINVINSLNWNYWMGDIQIASNNIIALKRLSNMLSDTDCECCGELPNSITDVLFSIDCDYQSYNNLGQDDWDLVGGDN